MKSNRQATDGGVGLGLSISKGIVEAHGGKIWVSNRSDGCAVFTMALPISSSEEEE
jgi:two-component system sensor histidine kinase KdpD